MSSSPPKTPPAESSSSDSNDDQEASLNSQTPESFQDLIPQISFNTQPQNIIKKQPIDSWLQEQRTLFDRYANNTLKNQPHQSTIEQCATSLGTALDEVSRNKQQNVMPRPQKPSAFTIKNLMSPPPLQKSFGSTRINTRMPAPHLGNVQSQEEQTASGGFLKLTGNSRIVGSRLESRIGTVRKGPAWWKRNVRKEVADRKLMPPPPPPQLLAVNKKVQAPEKPVVNQEELKRKLDNEKTMQLKRKKHKPPEFDQRSPKKLKSKGPAGNGGEVNGFLFLSSVSESEDDFLTLKFLIAYVLNGGNLAPKFESSVVKFINAALPENCKITVSQYRNKVVRLRRKFQHLVQKNGGENFTEADFSMGREYEMAEMCKIVWRDRQGSGGFGSFGGPKSNVGEIVRGVEGISLVDAGVLVDPGNESSDPGVNVDHGNRADVIPGVNTDHSIGLSDPGLNVDHANRADANPGVNMDQSTIGLSDLGVNTDHGNRADANPGVNVDHGIVADTGARDDQKKDGMMDIDE